MTGGQRQGWRGGQRHGTGRRATANWQSAHNAVCQFTAARWGASASGIGESREVDSGGWLGGGGGGGGGAGWGGRLRGGGGGEVDREAGLVPGRRSREG